MLAFDEKLVTLSSPRGTVTIPKKIRQKANLQENAILLASYSDGKIIFEPLPESPYPVREYTDAEIAQFLEDDKLDPKLAKKLDQKFGFKPFSSSK